MAHLVPENHSPTERSATFETFTRGKGKGATPGKAKGHGKGLGAAFTPVAQSSIPPVKGKEGKHSQDKAPVRPSADGTVTVTVPPLSVSVWRANQEVATDGPAPSVTLTAGSEQGVTGRAEIAAEVQTSTFAEATFLYLSLIHISEPTRRS